MSRGALAVAMAVAAETHRQRAAAAYEAELREATVWLAAQPAEFLFRDAMTQALMTARKEQLARPLRASEMHNVRAIVIGLWGDYARSCGIDVTAVYHAKPRVEALA